MDFAQIQELADAEGWEVIQDGTKAGEIKTTKREVDLPDTCTYECAYCEEEFTAEPIRDPHAVAWFGLEWAQIWCSEECMVKYAERAASNEPLGRGDLR